MDLSRSCDQFFNGCQCPDAERLVDAGIIICGQDICPEGCSVCNFCLEDVLDDCNPKGTPAPTSKPSWSPTKTPTKTPSVSPTVSSSSRPSLSPSSRPTPLFDLQVCDTYDLQWLRDLDTTCDPEVEGSCQCTNARARIDSGQIPCGVAQCPDDCEVCKFCLYEIEKCPWLDRGTPSPTAQASDRPSANPSVSSSTDPNSDEPSVSPTLAPVDITSSPSPLPFNLTDCSAYSGIWRFDLLTAGRCTTFETLVDNAKITCDSKCPEECLICDLCYDDSILDCGEPTAQPSPTVVFDLDNCASYEDRWLKEVVDTGICNEAIEREANGEISCREDTCPPGCSICEVCLAKIRCSGTATPSLKPTSSGPTISPHPTLIPTVSPTPEFRLDVCSSYSKLWLLDLSATCGHLDGFLEDSSTNNPYNSCQAIDAERKIAKGLITCGEGVCPEDCKICNFCLYDLLGCTPEQ